MERKTGGSQLRALGFRRRETYGDRKKKEGSKCAILSSGPLEKKKEGGGKNTGRLHLAIEGKNDNFPEGKSCLT